MAPSTGQVLSVDQTSIQMFLRLLVFHLIKMFLRLWHATDSIACDGFQLNEELTEGGSTCQTLALDNLPCMYPDCPTMDEAIADSNSTGIDPVFSRAKYKDYGNDNREGSQVEFNCLNESKLI